MPATLQNSCEDSFLPSRVILRIDCCSVIERTGPLFEARKARIDLKWLFHRNSHFTQPLLLDKRLRLLLNSIIFPHHVVPYGCDHLFVFSICIMVSEEYLSSFNAFLL
jgi:hypothetical protein